MIKVTINPYGITTEGHGDTKVCACVSMLMQELADYWEDEFAIIRDGSSSTIRLEQSVLETEVFSFVVKCMYDLVNTYPEDIVIYHSNKGVERM